MNVNSLIISSSNDLFAGTDNCIYRHTTTPGASWTAVNSGLTNTSVNALAISGSDVFAGTNNGVFYTANNGSSRTSVSSGLVYTLTFSGSNSFAVTNNGIFMLNPRNVCSPPHTNY